MTRRLDEGEGLRRVNRIHQGGIRLDLHGRWPTKTKQEEILMGSPPSDQEFHCPECGALLSVGADHCWKCRREFETTAGRPPISGGLSPSSCETYDNPFRSPSSREPGGNSLPVVEKGIRFFRLLGVVAIVGLAAGIAFIATCFGGFFVGSQMGFRAEGMASSWGWSSGLLLAVRPRWQ